MAGPAPDTISAKERAALRSARSLRNLYLFRTGFSAFWVALVFSLASAQAGGETAGLLGGILLVIYPVSDAIATLFDLRSGPIVVRWPQRLNLTADLAAAPAVLIALQSSLADAISLFGVWAISTGAVMIFLAARRQRVLSGQWFMLLSGAGSVFAGTTFVSWTGSSSAGLAVLAQYSAGGAVWYLLTAVWLSWTARSRPGRQFTPARSEFSARNRRPPRSAARSVGLSVVLAKLSRCFRARSCSISRRSRP
jgi:uncharacterized membrane protein HdeD (DUF308 family)